MRKTLKKMRKISAAGDAFNWNQAIDLCYTSTKYLKRTLVACLIRDFEQVHDENSSNSNNNDANLNHITKNRHRVWREQLLLWEFGT